MQSCTTPSFSYFDGMSMLDIEWDSGLVRARLLEDAGASVGKYQSFLHKLANVPGQEWMHARTHILRPLSTCQTALFVLPKPVVWFWLLAACFMLCMVMLFESVSVGALVTVLLLCMIVCNEMRNENRIKTKMLGRIVDEVDKMRASRHVRAHADLHNPF